MIFYEALEDPARWWLVAFVLVGHPASSGHVCSVPRDSARGPCMLYTSTRKEASAFFPSVLGKFFDAW